MYFTYSVVKAKFTKTFVKFLNYNSIPEFIPLALDFHPPQFDFILTLKSPLVISFQPLFPQHNTNESPSGFYNSSCFVPANPLINNSAPSYHSKDRNYQSEQFNPKP